MVKKNVKQLSAAAAFIALPDAEKDRIVAEFDRANVGDTFKRQGMTRSELSFADCKLSSAGRRDGPPRGAGSM